MLKNNPLQLSLSKSVFILLFAAIILITGCTSEEPRYRNVPVSIHLRRMKSDRDATADAAVEAVINMGAEAVPWLMEAWRRNEEITYRSRYARCFAAIGPDAIEALPMLTESLQSLDDDEISVAALAISGMGPQAAPAAPVLAELMATSEFTTQSYLLRAIGSIGPEAAGVAMEYVIEAADRDRTREDAIYALSNLGPLAIEAMHEWLQSGNSRQKIMACEVLSRTETNRQVYLPWLIDMFEDDDDRVRAAAARAIGEAGQDALVVVCDLIDALRDPDSDVRSSIVNTLISIGPEQFSDDLVNALTNRSPRVREGSIRVLMRFATLRDENESRFVARFDDSNVRVRSAAIEAVSGIGNSVIPRMIRLLDSDNVLVRFGAARVLGNLGPDARQAVPKLNELLQDRDSLVREEAENSLRKIRGA